MHTQGAYFPKKHVNTFDKCWILITQHWGINRHVEREHNFLTYGCRIDKHLTTTAVQCTTCLYHACVPIGQSLLKKNWICGLLKFCCSHDMLLTVVRFVRFVCILLECINCSGNTKSVPKVRQVVTYQWLSSCLFVCLFLSSSVASLHSLPFSSYKFSVVCLVVMQTITWTPLIYNIQIKMQMSSGLCQ
jgi:Na+/glutamate symporter